MPIDGVLDLHTFPPRETKNVVLAYLEVCQEQGILEVRIIHGKESVTSNERSMACFDNIPKCSHLHWPVNSMEGVARRL